MLASAHGHIETVTVLLAHRDCRGVNAQNKVRKNTPKRCRNTKLRDQDIYRTLPLCLSQDGWTALMAAAKVASHLEEHLRTGVRDPDEIARFASEIGRTCVAISEHLDTPRAN